ncbi:MAG TPA: hypothetical protein VFP84_12330 [Kofleriaceae bacterium]|nr:hypothetical protein [Kofleriaceae bacterium]
METTLIPWHKKDLPARVMQREVTAAEEGSIPTLNDFPPWMLAEARAIARESRPLAFEYIHFYLAKRDRASELDFVEEVLRGAADAATWRVGDRFVFLEAMSEAKALDPAWLERFTPLEGERWYRVKPDMPDQLHSEIPGMIGMIQRGVRYWERPRVGFGTFLHGSPDRIEPVRVEDLAIAMRRWFARRLAWWAREYMARAQGPVAEAGLVQHGLNTDMATLDEDTLRAARGLAREAHAFGTRPDFALRAGFLGPDDWYA